MYASASLENPTASISFDLLSGTGLLMSLILNIMRGFLLIQCVSDSATPNDRTLKNA